VEGELPVSKFGNAKLFSSLNVYEVDINCLLIFRIGFNFLSPVLAAIPIQDGYF